MECFDKSDLELAGLYNDAAVVYRWNTRAGVTDVRKYSPAVLLASVRSPSAPPTLIQLTSS
jgi:hypothetical protein